MPSSHLASSSPDLISSVIQSSHLASSSPDFISSVMQSSTTTIASTGTITALVNNILIPDIWKIICNQYLNGDVLLPHNIDGYADFSQYSQIFGEEYKNAMNPEASRINHLILKGDTQSLKTILDSVKKSPSLLYCRGMAPDRNGRWVVGTPIQTAIICGDANHKWGLLNKENFGIAEILMLILPRFCRHTYATFLH